MGSSAADMLPIVQRSYDLCAALYEHVNRFPRAQRGLLGRVILDDGLRMLGLLAVANRRREKSETLAEASGHLDALRITVRLGKRLGYVSNSGYGCLSEHLDEVGRMLGGWLKYQSAAEAAPATPAAVAEAEAAPAPAPAEEPKRRGGVRYTMKSPTVEKYLRAKLAHPQAVVFVTVGAFCQTFFEDAAFCNRALRLAVRNVAAASEPEKILMCGIPRDKLDKYIALLQRVEWEAHVE